MNAASLPRSQPASTVKAACLSPRGRTLRAVLLLPIVISVAISVVSAAPYLFVPGHGITGRTGAVNCIEKTFDELLAECTVKKADGTPERPWMRIVEMAYEWGNLEYSVQNNNSPNGYSPGGWNYANIDKIVAHAAKCGRETPRKYLRVMLEHKFAYLPVYLTQNQQYAAYYEQYDNCTNQNKKIYNIKLDLNYTYGRLQALYKEVIRRIKQDPDAMKGFYGFVIQETALGKADYFNPDIGDPNGNHSSGYFANLRRFHWWLAGYDAADSYAEMKDFSTGTATPGRLFWQMINSPQNEVNAIVANIVNDPSDPIAPGIPGGVGLCGPDTFPMEPAGNKLAVYNSYNLMRFNRGKVPISLHVYAGNYRGDRAPHHNNPPADYPVLDGVQPLWDNIDLPSASPAQFNKDAGVGLMNFLGCVTNINSGQRPDRMRVHNVIWAFANGRFAAGTTDAPYPSGDWGWDMVLAWKENELGKGANSKFPGGTYGGCNASVPTRID